MCVIVSEGLQLSCYICLKLKWLMNERVTVGGAGGRDGCSRHVHGEGTVAEVYRYSRTTGKWVNTDTPVCTYRTAMKVSVSNLPYNLS